MRRRTRRRWERRARRFGPWAAGLAAALVLVALLAGGGDDPATPGTTVVAVPASDLPDPALLDLGRGDRHLGFNDQTWLFTGGPQPALDKGVTPERQLADLAGAGADSVRITVSWYDVEPEPGRFDDRYLERIERVVRPLEERGGRVLLVLGVPPSWARADPATPTSTIHDRPDVIERFAAFAGHVAARFPRAAGIEIWNEPNTTYFWRPRRPEPELYARMHTAATAMIRRAAPDVPVLLAGILSTPVETENVLLPTDYVAAAVRAGLRAADVDGFAFHAYPVPSQGQSAGQRDRVFRDAIAEAIEARDRSLPGKPLWVTETGLTRSGAWGVPAPEQARELLRALRRFYAREDVRGVWINTLYERTEFPEDSIERGFGLLTAAGPRTPSPSPAYCALRLATDAEAPVTGCPEAPAGR